MRKFGGTSVPGFKREGAGLRVAVQFLLDVGSSFPAGIPACRFGRLLLLPVRQGPLPGQNVRPVSAKNRKAFIRNRDNSENPKP